MYVVNSLPISSCDASHQSLDQKSTTRKYNTIIVKFIHSSKISAYLTILVLFFPACLFKAVLKNVLSALIKKTEL